MFKPMVVFVILCAALFAVGSISASINRGESLQVTRKVTASVVAFSIIRVPFDYPTIQEAIDAAAPGSTVLVSGGLYVEHLVVNKTLTLLGEDRTITILDGGGDGTIISVAADNVLVNGFTVRNGSYGIAFIQSHNSTISSNLLTLDLYGVSLENSTETLVSDNVMTTCGVTGVWSEGGAIWLWYSDNNTIRDNLIVEGNIGLAMGYSHYNSVYGNTIANSHWGILLDYSNSNLISRNTLSGNYYVMRLGYSDDNRIHHNNFIDYRELSLYDSFYNSFDDGVEGNYWDTYTGLDNGNNWRVMGDGIGDTGLPHLGVDWYPLISPHEAIPVVLDYVAYPVGLTSNSTVSALSLDQAGKRIIFTVNVPNATTGYCNVTIPKNLLHGPWIIVIDNINVTSQSLITENETHTLIAITYAHSSHNVQLIATWVVPEFPLSATLLGLMLLITFFVSTLKKAEKRKMHGEMEREFFSNTSPSVRCRRPTKFCHADDKSPATKPVVHERNSTAGKE